MKIRIPKDMSGIKFAKALIIDLNDFDVDFLLPSLFFTILSQGRGKARQSNDPTRIQNYINLLAQNPALEGFQDKTGHRLLERLVRTTLIKTGSVGRSNKGEQILSIVPYTLLAHKPGFPGHFSRNRSADTFIYQILRDNLQKADDRLLETIKHIFGKGVIINSMPDLGGSYDGKTELDTLTRLSVAFMDSFQNTRTGLSREQTFIPACPTLANEMATDLLRFLFAYHECMPSQAFTYHLLALINFELFNYTLKLVNAINELVTHPEALPIAMSEKPEFSPPQLYLDFINDAHNYSYEMAKACVRRDIEAYQQFLPSILHLRLLDSYVDPLKRNAQRRARIEAVLEGATSGPQYLQRLLFLEQEPALAASIEALAQRDEERIREENKYIDDTKSKDSSDNREDAEMLAWLDEITDIAETDIGRVVNLLVEGQKSDGLAHFTRWYWGVGGIKKPHGVLVGTTRSRQSWRYAPSNDLLAVLVQIAAARLTEAGDKELQPIRLRDFLRFLERRFGILIDRPPDNFQGAEYAAAARDNLRAMLSRLRQMGIFRDLSDDFTVQSLHPPYAGRSRRVEAQE
jgi:hypothetical protein